MKSLFRALICATCLIAPMAASAASLSGIVLYTTDDFGTPNGAQTLLNDELQAQLWLTAFGGEWHVLGVWAGLPPQSLGSPPLNGADLTLDVPLVEGENDFTILGQPGPLTRTDDYQRFAVNLYFDAVLDHPGISVLFPAKNSFSGSPTSPNRSDRIYGLSLARVNFPPQITYDDGTDTVSVMAASFLAPEFAGIDSELVSAHQLAPPAANDPNGSDFIGVLKIMVEPSANPGGGQVVGAPAAAGFGIIPGGVADSGTLHGADIPIGGADPRDAAEPGPRTRGAEDSGWRAGARGDSVAKAAGTAEPTAVAEESTTPGGTPTAASTPKSRTPSGTVSPTAGAGTTATPVATRGGATPTPRVSTTASITTPTAAVVGAPR